jgi:hypothetical protein
MTTKTNSTRKTKRTTKEKPSPGAVFMKALNKVSPSAAQGCAELLTRVPGAYAHLVRQCSGEMLETFELLGQVAAAMKAGNVGACTRPLRKLDKLGLELGAKMRAELAGMGMTREDLAAAMLAAANRAGAQA